ncbi:MAG: hypothetical protein K6B67_08200 [Lachnospiraceae bacterium]|nr:hypothetical protein [Lachnospiraceae bacterium]
MQEIIREYGPAIITLVAIGALIGLITILVGKDGTSVVGQAFSKLLNQFFELPTAKGGILWTSI